jgi:P pilus assembly chaperone PapD
MKTKILTLLLCTFSQSAFSAFMLNGSRFIYNEDHKNIALEITNNSKETYGGQVWIDNVLLPKDDVAFVPMPSFFKVNGGKIQVVRIMNINELVKDKESVFWLNVQEIPPANKEQKNAMVVAIHTQVKLIYRPTSLMANRQNAESKLILVKQGNSYMLNNPTPYFFSLTTINVNGKEVELTNALSEELSIVSPKSSILLNGVELTPSSKVIIKAIDDYGTINEYKVR